MTTWLKDNNGNKCSVEFFGSEEAAQKALDSLKNCDNCINCSSGGILRRILLFCQPPHVGHCLLISFMETNRADRIGRIALAIDQLSRKRCPMEALKRITGFASLMDNPSSTAMRRAGRVP